MNSKVLQNSNALNSGSSLWILPDPPNSSWSSQIDWYLNGLITRSEHRNPQELSGSLKKILKEEEILAFDFKTQPDAPLIISSKSYLPNEMTVILPFSTSPKEWRNKISELWRSLNAPTLRVFLPKGFKAEDFLDGFPNMHFEKNDTQNSLSSTQIQLTVVGDSN